MENFNWIPFFQAAAKIKLPGQAWQVLNYVMARKLAHHIGDDLEFNVKAIALELGMARTSVSRAIMTLKRFNVLKASDGTTNKQLRYLRVVHPELWGIYGTQKEEAC
jgi:hypothetical protein